MIKSEPQIIRPTPVAIKLVIPQHRIVNTIGEYKISGYDLLVPELLALEDELEFNEGDINAD